MSFHQSFWSIAKELATLENAIQYEKEQDRYIWTETLIESNYDVVATESRVNLLEDAFTRVLAENSKLLVHFDATAEVWEAFVISPSGNRQWIVSEDTHGAALDIARSYLANEMTAGL